MNRPAQNHRQKFTAKGGYFNNFSFTIKYYEVIDFPKYSDYVKYSYYVNYNLYFPMNMIKSFLRN